MMKRFAADVVFLDPNDVPRAMGALAGFNCDYEIDPDAVDPHSPAVFGVVTGTTELDQSSLGDWLISIVRPFGGDVSSWGYDAPWKRD